MDADAPEETLEELRRDADDHCPGAYCIRNPIDSTPKPLPSPQLRSGRLEP